MGIFNIRYKNCKFELKKLEESENLLLYVYTLH